MQVAVSNAVGNLSLFFFDNEHVGGVWSTFWNISHGKGTSNPFMYFFFQNIFLYLFRIWRVSFAMSNYQQCALTMWAYLCAWVLVQVIYDTNRWSFLRTFLHDMFATDSCTQDRLSWLNLYPQLSCFPHQCDFSRTGGNTWAVTKTLVICWIYGDYIIPSIAVGQYKDPGSRHFHQP